eukprot:361687-Chlamydomonas_euryale.AAC.4
MNEDLLQDLALYRKYRDKEVSSAAKGLIGLFREINPAMLSKKDRGRGADLGEYRLISCAGRRWRLLANTRRRSTEGLSLPTPFFPRYPRPSLANPFPA